MGSEKLKSFVSDAGLIKRDEQLSELTVERLGSFIDTSMVEIPNAYHELNLSKTRVQRGARAKVMFASGNIQSRSSRFKYN